MFVLRILENGFKCCNKILGLRDAARRNSINYDEQLSINGSEIFISGLNSDKAMLRG